MKTLTLKPDTFEQTFFTKIKDDWGVISSPQGKLEDIRIRKDGILKDYDTVTLLTHALVNAIGAYAKTPAKVIYGKVEHDDLHQKLIPLTITIESTEIAVAVAKEE